MNIHAQQDFYAVKMEQSKIIKNTVQRKNPIIQEKIDHVRCEAKKAVQEPWKNNTNGASSLSIHNDRCQICNRHSISKWRIS